MYAELKRKCYKCEEIKSLCDFHRDRTQAQGHSYECKKCRLSSNIIRAQSPKKKKSSAEYEFKRGLRRNYNMTIEQYNVMFNAQEGKCACCGKHQDNCKRKLAVDHDHDTGAIRALLCDNCNPGIGYFKHSIERLNQAIKYLNKFQN